MSSISSPGLFLAMEPAQSIMSLANRNNYLDIPSDEESEGGSGYDSENADRKPALRATKRQRTERDRESVSDNSEVDREDENISAYPRSRSRTDVAAALMEDESEHIYQDKRDEGAHEETNKDMQDSDHKRPSSRRSPAEAYRSRTLHALPTSVRDPKKTGVVYISRIPPFMKPSTLRGLLAPHAPRHGLARLFLTPEPAASHSQRVRAGGNKKRSYTDGWVEFCSKREARACVDALNAHIVGGRKGGWYHDDVWNMRYLRGFKWEDLMAQMRGERAERDGRMRAEIAEQTRENKRYLDNLERGKALKGMQEKRKAKRARAGSPLNEQQDTPRTTFRQNEVKDKRAMKPLKPVEEPRSDVDRILGNIF